jgi:hypothetical protein
MTKGKYDLTGVVTSAAVKSATPHTVVLLVAAESSRISAGGSQVAQARYEVTVTDASGSWAASQINTLTAQ